MMLLPNPQVRKTPGGPLEVVEGQVVIAKHPVMHPGDVRTFRAVSCPQLLHHKNVLVLPQLGHRPHANEMSGSDLDGDIYAVMWDQSLLRGWNNTPMDYTAERPVEVPQVGGWG
jgi:RNA-dependent RNA polymerase